MSLQFLFQILLLLLTCPIRSVAKSPPPPPPPPPPPAMLTMPNCPSHCGNVSIPLPFGIGADCYFHDWYAIDCKSNRPFLRSIGLEVLNFSLQTSTMRVHQPVERSCQDRADNVSFVNLENLPFYFSYHDNIFTGVGCDNLAYMSTGDFILGGCFSICNLKNTTEDKSCNGIKCCKTGVAGALKSFDISVESINNEMSNSSRVDQEDCKYAFLVETEWFNNNFMSPNDVQEWKQVPVVLDFRIANSSFQHLAMNKPARNGSTFDCTADDGGLILCTCHRGYHGNPYLLEGCQDIDECKSGNARICGSGLVCQNYIGGYRCISPNRMAHELMLGVGSGLGGLFLCIGALWIGIKMIKSMKQKKNFERNGGLLLQQQLNSFDSNVDKCKIFNSMELDKATDHFNESRFLGQGGQGTVYKGMLADGRIIAVKKSKVVDKGRLKEFINEVVILSQINHRNVVKLLGCCLETEFPLLVYEFIPNGTLFEYRHDQNEGLPFTWDIRLRIAAEVAEALSYLHSGAPLPIYHRDIKSTNILLDEKYRAKLADFGTSRSLALDQTHVSTKVQGTFGYFDPEYFHSSQFTDKSDVYSFGVVLVELLTGQKPLSSTWTKLGGNLATFFMISMEENRLDDIIDAKMREQGKRGEIMSVANIANIANRCLNHCGRNRPTMKEVAMELERIRGSQGDNNVAQQTSEEIEYLSIESIGPRDSVYSSRSSTYI